MAVWPDCDHEWRNVDRWPNSAAREQALEVFNRLATLTGFAGGATPADNGGPPCLRFADDAQAEFDDWRAKLETRLRADDTHPALEACLAKHRSLIPSLALLIHLADSPEGGPVPLAALLKACAWGEYLETHARRIYSAQTKPALISAAKLAAKISDGTLKSRFTLRDVYRSAWSRLDTLERAQAAVNVLIDHDWLCPEVEPTGGRPRTMYVINPKLLRAKS